METVNSLLEQIQSLDYEAKGQIYEALRQEMINEEIIAILRKYRERSKVGREEGTQHHVES
jgi:hypothetical protein